MPVKQFLDKDGLIEAFRLAATLGGLSAVMSTDDIQGQLNNALDSVNDRYDTLKELVSQRIADGLM